LYAALAAWFTVTKQVVSENPQSTAGQGIFIVLVFTLNGSNPRNPTGWNVKRPSKLMMAPSPPAECPPITIVVFEARFTLGRFVVVLVAEGISSSVGG